MARAGAYDFCFLRIADGVYYSSVARSARYKDIAGLAALVGGLVPRGSEWVCIFDCKGLSVKHVGLLDVIRKTVNTFEEDEGLIGGLRHFVIINAGPIIQTGLDFLVSLLDKRGRDRLVKCGTSPIEIVETVRRCGVGLEALRWLNRATAVGVDEALPAVVG